MLQSCSIHTDVKLGVDFGQTAMQWTKHKRKTVISILLDGRRQRNSLFQIYKTLSDTGKIIGRPTREMKEKVEHVKGHIFYHKRELRASPQWSLVGLHSSKLYSPNALWWKVNGIRHILCRTYNARYNKISKCHQEAQTPRSTRSGFPRPPKRDQYKWYCSSQSYC